MKLVIAIIRPEKIEAVQDELRQVLDESDNYRITIAPVEGHGVQRGEIEYVRGQAMQSPLTPRLQITIGLNDAYVEPAIQAIIRGARTGAVGDGKIFIQHLEDCVRIRTGERGGQAI